MVTKTGTAVAATTGLISWRSALRAVPLRNRAAAVEQDDSDHVQITVKRELPRYMVPPVTWVVKPRSHATIQLDPVGTDVWRLCDGARDVERIAEQFSRRHRLTFHEARVAVCNYLKLLVERGAMVLAQPQEDRAQA